MKLSLDWLGSYVDIDGISPDEIAQRMTMAVAEVEDVEKLTRTIKGVVAARVIAAEPIDAGPGKTLHHVTVDAGGTEWRTVCGAPNVTVGMISAFAPPGTVLADGSVVGEQTLYGSVSSGMLASPRELGWGESHVGIMAFSDMLEPGTPLADLVPAVDHIIDIDNKSITHRPDLWGHYGFARELSAVFHRELKPLDCADAAEWEKLEKFPLFIDDTDGCPGYGCLDIDNLRPAFSLLPIQYRLLAVGQRPINLLVDLTNFIMLELGQPMHAFDGERVRDIIVAPFRESGRFRTLDSIARPMVKDDLMIMDHTGPIAIAGIMGGEESEIKDDTTRLLLESANFHPARIRRTALRLGLRTDASLRFEKGQPPYHMGVSIRRFVTLLRDNGLSPVVRSRLTIVGDTGETPRTMTLQSSYLSRTIGMELPQETVSGILESLGFGCAFDGDDLTLTIPCHRSARDVSIPNDIVEEVARVYGYDNITPTMPDNSMATYVFNAQLAQTHKLQRLLSMAHGFVEVQTYSWFDDAWLNRIGYDPGETLKLQNPATETTSRIRHSLMPNLLALVEPNTAHRDRFMLYETGAVFIPRGDDRDQVLRLGAVACQTDRAGSLQDLFSGMKGVVDDIFDTAGAGTPSYVPVTASSSPWCREGSSLDIVRGTETIGTIGYMTGPMQALFEKGTQIVWFEIDLDHLGEAVYPELTYDPAPIYPGSWMDFSIAAPAETSYADLASSLDTFTHPIVTKRRFLYRYAGKGIAKGSASYTFRYWLGLRDRTLTGEDLADFRTAFLTCLTTRGLTLR